MLDRDMGVTTTDGLVSALPMHTYIPRYNTVPTVHTYLRATYIHTYISTSVSASACGRAPEEAGKPKRNGNVPVRGRRLFASHTKTRKTMGRPTVCACPNVYLRTYLRMHWKCTENDSFAHLVSFLCFSALRRLLSTAGPSRSIHAHPRH